MVSIMALWLPIVLSAVVVFVASSILHMVLKYHWNDYQKLAKEDEVMEALRNAGVGPGNYAFPRPADAKDMSSPEMVAKYNKGPVAYMNVIPNGPPAMGKYLALWFVYCLLVGLFAAYISGRTLGAGTDYLAVFRVAGAVSFVAYGLANFVDSVWKAQRWSTTIKHMIDGLIYSLLTGGVFGWLWP